MKSTPTVKAQLDQVPDTDAARARLESEQVHAVYNAIAPHFSATRYKPWPVVERFLMDLAPGSVGCDIGCGNGKYLGVNPQLWTLGMDRSDQLVAIARDRGFDAVVGDALAVPAADDRFDFCLSIAVIHHFSSPSRRIAAVRELLRVLKPGGRALVYVWALEQQSAKRTFPGQDVLVPWHMPVRDRPAASTTPTSAAVEAIPTIAREDGRVDQVYQRYYHMYVAGELDADVVAAGGRVLETGYDRDNHYCIISPM
ncbi:S-adenosyl-L-methionine-dependent methyltransferase [Blastocladiella britannica]|nr:S-adenosyl-L-methionine-dependent methyltransferase [Blastocladiella britannica]